MGSLDRDKIPKKLTGRRQNTVENQPYWDRYSLTPLFTGHAMRFWIGVASREHVKRGEA